MIMEPCAAYTAKLALRIEEMGFDLLLTPDTQNLCADPYGQLSLAAANTRTLKLGTGVTNPVTRVAAVTASAMATLQIESAGRAICGIGRGDSSAAHIGQRQATTRELRDYRVTVKPPRNTFSVFRHRPYGPQPTYFRQPPNPLRPYTQIALPLECYYSAGTRRPDLGDLAVFGSPFGQFCRYPHTPVRPQILVGRRNSDISAHRRLPFAACNRDGG